MIRLALPVIGGSHWLGGHNWLVNLLHALAAEGEGRVGPVVFAGTDTPAEQLRDIRCVPGVEVAVSPTFDGRRKARRLAAALAAGVDREALDEFRARRIDVAFESATYLGRRFPLPTVAWFPDFQHRHLPELFGRGAWWRRELGFRAQVRSGRTILVSSFDAKDDCERFYPGSRGRVHVARFAKPAGAPVDPGRVRAVIESHGLPRRYFFLPNQFWRHKNHECVIDALALLAARGAAPVVAMSGRQEDPRDPGHVPRLRRRIEEAGLDASARLLGVLPHGDVAALLAGATALVNPSRFEGWSTTVEEAKALGVPMLLSSLAVHREQAGEAARYFSPDAPAELATLLESAPDVDAAEAAARRSAAALAAARRVREFAAAFAAAVESAAHDPHR